MLVFVDESGDTGFKLGSGSSEQFTITLVVFAENEQAEAASHRIDALRTELGLSEDSRKGEFHFNDSSNSQREAFLTAVSIFGFSIFSVTINKTGLASEGISSKSAFYNFVCGLAFDNAKNYLTEANIVIDSTAGKEFKQQLGKYIRQRMNELGNERCIKQIRMKPSHTENLLQLADMVCGAIVRDCHEDKRKPSKFRNIIRHREVSVLMWP